MFDVQYHTKTAFPLDMHQMQICYLRSDIDIFIKQIRPLMRFACMLMFQKKYTLVGYPAMYFLVLPPAWASLLRLHVTVHEFSHPIQLLSQLLIQQLSCFCCVVMCVILYAIFYVFSASFITGQYVVEEVC